MNLTLRADGTPVYKPVWEYLLATPREAANVSAASYQSSPLAAESIVSAFGSGLASATMGAIATPLPTMLAGTTVKVRDSAGSERPAPLFFVSPTQINYQMPVSTAPGAATITITGSDGAVSTGNSQIAAVAPGLFAADASGRGLAAALALRIKADGSQSYEPVAQFDPAQNKLVAAPIDLGPETDQVFLILFGTGLRFRSSLNAVTARIGAVDAPVVFAGPLEGFVGLDQVNVLLPRTLIGRGTVSVTLTVDGKSANSVQAEIKTQWSTPVISAPQLQYRTFYSAAAKSIVSYHIYTPEQYDRENERRFPVLYWLHGTGGGLAGIQPLRTFFDNAIRSGIAPPMLIVFANGLPISMWCDSKDGRVTMETVVVKELLPHIDATFRTIASREGRLIEGFSMGGYGAGRLGFKYPDVFGAVSMLAGGPLDLEFMGPRATADPEERELIFQNVYGGDIEYFKAQSPWVLAEQNAAAVRNRTRVRQVVGDRDGSLAQNRDFDAQLTRLNIPHAFTVLPNVGHDTLAIFNALGAGNWDFYRAVFGANVSPKVHIK
jgi:uncharacterized protein (TIGR03437 family)